MADLNPYNYVFQHKKRVVSIVGWSISGYFIKFEKKVWGKNELKLHLHLVFTTFSSQQKPAWKFLYTLNDAIIMKVSYSIRLDRLLFLAHRPA